LNLPEGVWTRLTAAWVLYCLFMAALNGYVVVFFSTSAWMSFKVWGFVFPVVFIIGQGFYVSRHLDAAAAPPESDG
jgi:intracellular septation protein